MSVDLDELQVETEKLLVLLTDRQPGLSTWNDSVRERLMNIHNLTSQAFGKDSEPMKLCAVIDTDLDPRLPFARASIEKHVRVGKVTIEKRADGLYIDGKKVILYRSQRQMDGKAIRGYELRMELDGQPVLSASILDFLIVHPEYIPEEWKEKDKNGNIILIFFWATIYCDSGGGFFVRCLYWYDGVWSEGYYWLDRGWSSGYPAAALVS